jgi:membrane-bound lytic murein transglycosylase D
MARDIFKSEGLPEILIYLPLIESAYSPHAHSPVGAVGIWQFMSSTAGGYGLIIDFWVDERRDPIKSTQKAAQHLSYLFKYYKNWELALAAYNAGVGSVNRAIKRGRTRDYWKLSTMGLLKRETREYVPRFFAAAHIAQNHSVYGFAHSENNRFPEYEILTVDQPIDLSIFSQKTEVSLKTYKFLNPELNRLLTPIGKSYGLRVPKDKYADALRVYFNLPKDELVGVKRYTVRYGDTLGDIAESNDTSVVLLKHLNGIRNPRRLYAGQSIVIPIGPEGVEQFNEIARSPIKGFKTQEINYIIRQGDTLWEIARRFNLDIETLLWVNGMTFSTVLMPDDEIKIWLDLAFER